MNTNLDLTKYFVDIDQFKGRGGHIMTANNMFNLWPGD